MNKLKVDKMNLEDSLDHLTNLIAECWESRKTPTLLDGYRISIQDSVSTVIEFSETSKGAFPLDEHSLKKINGALELIDNLEKNLRRKHGEIDYVINNAFKK